MVWLDNAARALFSYTLHVLLHVALYHCFVAQVLVHSKLWQWAAGLPFLPHKAS
jgi:hypothetical protein